MMRRLAAPLLCSSFFLLMACGSNNTNSKNPEQNTTAKADRSVAIKQTYQVEAVSHFNEPWAVTSLPDQRLLVTERQGKLKIFNPKNKQMLDVQGVPAVNYGGQGGLGDVILHSDFAKNHWVYLSYATKGQGGSGAVISRAKLDLSHPHQPKLNDIKQIWQQVPKVSGQGHYGHRMLFGTDGKLWVSSGERQKFDPAQNMKSNLGKILRLNEDGTAAVGNPFYKQSGVTAEIWSLGHRNPLGMAFDRQGQLWVVEMGPKGGDELNIITKGENYGYPIVSNGDHYSGQPIPDHHTRPEFKAPEIDWTPVISPSSMIIYRGQQFPAWQNKALIGGLSSEAIIVVDLEHKPVKEVQRLDMKKRIRGLHEAKDGSIWVIEDGSNARLLKLSKKPS
ncbi:PQQ-dependent sugar dehydrogenase [Acinetobacter pittii]|uniref:PQQ-dependent sugar dehydrogenase n=1 Tax=Acinetobacter pittii TaxID=48296 RepID=UPI00035D049D|nr:PQQ-dependent sugar dehydrogenase [Acinetobacter pittii]QNB04028.1 PQQ-dependent sugar dehydrogenase [Acinetobacter baumannii]KQE54004.1 glucose dehydrogenase [Acinetobacter pittii]MBK0407515.1 PQQ-dependent sugar dehydrogenase [Acinetobacter pittii]MCK0867983.1 PQQ-dependent sugar dehydrogenase [Acinetobacter pittii]MCK0920869.1 PQQ-dependent sugar dehydrogenase [Acinetobacter pittii]